MTNLSDRAMSDVSPSNAAISSTTPEQEKLNFTTKLAYGAGDMGPAITANILVFFLLYFFTNVAGLPAGLASLILAIGKISDAINDPITGILSDRTRSRWGRRLPWILGGGQSPLEFCFPCNGLSLNSVAMKRLIPGGYLVTTC